jgi:TolB-like protein/DNA-binding winged helix-turn-helix (wHTH) protein/Flp pilus assembly protein TadD
MLREPGPYPVSNERLALGDFVLDISHGELLDRLGRPADLRAQALRVLLVLGERPGQVVGKDELMRRVWGDAVVTDDSLVQAIGGIRRLLGAAGHDVLRTVPRRGYLLCPSQRGAAGAAPLSGPLEVPEAKHAESRAPTAAAWPWLPWLPGAREGSPRMWMLTGAALVTVLLAIVATLRPPRDAPPPLRTLAIMPFEAEDPIAADAWFSDAITGDLNTMVARWGGGPQVIGRGTMQTYKGKGTDPRAVGRELGVAFVLTGRVRREGDRVRIAVELVDTATAQVLWARPFELDRGELPGSVGDIAGGIAKALNIEIGDVVTRNLQPLDPAQADADDLAMHGWSVFLKNVGAETFEQSRQLFEQALARDPRSLRALAGVSLTNSMNVSFNNTSDKEASMRRSQQALARLEAIDPAAHLTLIARASYLLSSADWTGQFAVSEELVRGFPNDPTSYHHRCSSLLRLGRFDEAIPACDRAIRISPHESRTPVWHALAGMNEFMRGNYAAAVKRARVAATANTKVPFFAVLLAAALAQDGHPADARQIVDEFRQRNPVFDSASIGAIWQTTNAHQSFIDGRNRLIQTVRDLGLP